MDSMPNTAYERTIRDLAWIQANPSLARLYMWTQPYWRLIEVKLNKIVVKGGTRSSTG